MLRTSVRVFVWIHTSITFTRTPARVENECCCPRTVNISMLTLLQKYLYHQSQYSATWDSKCLALIAQMVRAFGMNPKRGVRVPLRSRHFLSQKLWHFHKSARSCGENECCCSHTVNISNVNFTSKISTPPEPVFNNMGQQMSGPDSIRHESGGWGFESPSGRDIFCLKNFDTFRRTPVRVSEMNAVARAQLTFQMITLLQKHIALHRLSSVGPASPEEGKTSPFGSEIACLCQCIKINNTKHVYRQNQVRKPTGSDVKGAEYSLIRGIFYRVQVLAWSSMALLVCEWAFSLPENGLHRHRGSNPGTRRRQLVPFDSKIVTASDSKLTTINIYMLNARSS